MDSLKKITIIKSELNALFPERENVINGLLTAVIAGEHVLLLGPPGTGKSLLSKTFSDSISLDSYFQLLMTKFTTPEEIFGPIKFSSLKVDKYEREMTGYCQSKRVWFLDEIWKAGSSILNCLLTAMQERTFRNGTSDIRLPLLTVVAASNEYPSDDLNAMFDRFSQKFWVEYLSEKGFQKLCANSGKEVKTKCKLLEEDFEDLENIMSSMTFSSDNFDRLQNIKKAAEAEGFTASDRTWMKSVKLIKAQAIVNGRQEIKSKDFVIISNMIWKKHTDFAALKSLISNAADPYAARLESLGDGIVAALKDLVDINEISSGRKTKLESLTAAAKTNSSIMSIGEKITEILTANPNDTDVLELENSYRTAIDTVAATTKAITLLRVR